MPRRPEVCRTVFCPHITRDGSSLLTLLLPYFCCIFFLLIIQHSSVITARAQGSSATLSGTVTDPNRAVIPGVNITVFSITQGFHRGTTTNENGHFVVPSLPPSTYTVKAEREGFQMIEVPNIVLNVNSQVSIEIELKVGNIDGSNVDVIYNVPLVKDSPEISTVVDRQLVGNLPLNGRSFQSLLTLTPGLVLTATDLNGTEPGQFSVNGQRANANYFMVDGVSANVSVGTGLVSGQLTGGSLPALAATGGTNNLVSVDALQEFRVQTSTYAPEFGRMPGGQISIATRSGTNDFHGTLFDYFRNDLFDANDWFNNLAGQPKPATRQHDFGGVLGGPILLPGYNGRNATHFFFSYEGLRLRQPQATISFVPSLAAREAAPAAVRPFLDAFPIPNGPANAATRLAQFAASYSNPLTLDATSIRIDRSFGNSTTLFGRYNYAPSEAVQRGASSTLNTLTSNATTTQTLTFGGTFVFTPRLINEARFNYSHVTSSTSFELDTFGGAVIPPDSLLFPSTFSAANAQFAMLVIGARNGFLTVGKGADNLQRQFNILDTLSWVHGAHSLKFGVDYRRLMPVIGPRAYSQINTFFGVNQFLTGRSSFSQVNAEAFSREPVFLNLSLFAQDTWKISRRLTLTSGLRWEVNPTPSERNGNDPRTVTGFDDPATTVLAPAGTPLYETTYTNFAPRIGFAYRLREAPGAETTLRGGIGVFYDVGNGETAGAFGPGAFPYSTTKRVPFAPFPLSPANAAPAPFGPVPSQATILAFEPNLKLPYTWQYNFAVEQSLGANQSLSASYIAARGRRLLRTESFQALPQFSSVLVIKNTATSDYDSMQVQFQRRLSRGLQVLTSYTLSKSIDTASDEATQFASTTRIDPEQDRGPSDFDVRHAFSGAVSYMIPMWNLGPFGNAILKNWAVESIVRANSAPPINVTTGLILFGTRTVARPDLIQGVPLYIADSTVAGGRRINPDAFAPVPDVDGSPTRQGSLGRNSLRAFPFSQVDLTLRRQFNLTERVKLQFRTDFFNLFNHPNFGPMCSNLNECFPFGVATRMFGTSLGAGGLGTGFNPLYQVGGPRSTQFSLKLEF